MKKAISEAKLVIPALIVLSQAEEIISSKQLKKGILEIVKPKKADLEQLADREQTIIDSRIDNLISHRTLEEYATYSKMEGSSKIYLRINGKGKTYLSKKILEMA